MNPEPLDDLPQRKEWQRRTLGVAMVVAIYGAQVLAYGAIRGPFQQSVMMAICIPAILIVGWLLAGLVLGAMVINRSCGGWRFAIGLVCSLLLSFLFIKASLYYLSNLPETYQGP